MEASHRRTVPAKVTNARKKKVRCGTNICVERVPRQDLYEVYGTHSLVKQDAHRVRSNGTRRVRRAAVPYAHILFIFVQNKKQIANYWFCTKMKFSQYGGWYSRRVVFTFHTFCTTSVSYVLHSIGVFEHMWFHFVQKQKYTK